MRFYDDECITTSREMTWKPTDHVDEQVRGWMRARRWEVTATDYHFEQEVYSWRHPQPGGKSPTLRIARNVLEHNPHS